jgi:hypothetical protein
MGKKAKRKTSGQPKTKIPLKNIQKRHHPLYDILEYIIKSNGIDIFQNIQKCRGLLKDYSQSEYKKEVELLSILIGDNIPYELMRYNGRYYHGALVEKIYREKYLYSEYENEYKDIISLLIDFLSEQGLLRANIKPEDDKVIFKLKRYCQRTAPFVKRYIYSAYSVCKKNYKISVPAVVLLLVVVFSISLKWRASDAMNHNSRNDYGRQSGEQLEPVRTYAYVSSYALNLRSGPSLSSTIITQLKQNDKIEIISAAGAWALVLFGSYRGYVNSSYLSNNQIPVQLRQNANQSASTLQKENIPLPPKLDLADREVKEKE